MKKKITKVLGLGWMVMACVLAWEVGYARAQALPQGKDIMVLPVGIFEELKGRALEHHYFGGQRVYLPVLVNQSEEGVFNLRAELTQKGFSLQAPTVIDPIIISSLKDKRPLSCQQLLSLELPEVKKRTTFLLNLQVASESAQEWQKAGEVEVHVYPRDIMAPLKDWSKKVQLRLYDPQGQLSEFLEAQGIAFVDYRAQRPKGQDQIIMTILVGETAEELLKIEQSYSGETVILLREKSDRLPKVVVRPHHAGTLIDAHVQFLSNIVNDPRGQETLMDILQLTNTFNP